MYLHLKMCSVKQLISINRIQNKSIIYIIYIYVYTVNIYYVFINTHIQCIFWKIDMHLDAYIYIHIIYITTRIPEMLGRL